MPRKNRNRSRDYPKEKRKGKHKRMRWWETVDLSLELPDGEILIDNVANNATLILPDSYSGNKKKKKKKFNLTKTTKEQMNEVANEVFGSGCWRMSDNNDRLHNQDQ